MGERASVAYLACPYSHPDPAVKRMRFTVVNWVAREMALAGQYAYSPLTHNIPLDQLDIHGNWETWAAFDHSMLGRCDKLLILKLDGWEESKGVAAERQRAEELGLPIEFVECPQDLVEKALDTVSSPFSDLTHRQKIFYEARDWDQFHSPKNLAMVIASESGELIEHFRWLTEEQSYTLDDKTHGEVADEIGDLVLALSHLAHKLGIDPLEAAHDKLEKIGRKYPVEASKGKCLKYTAYEED